MKCVSCGNKTRGNHLVCPKCSGIESHLQFLEAHKCGSFFQIEGEAQGTCRNALMCEPIKRALKNEPLIDPQIGHVFCPYASINLYRIIHSEFDKHELRNYTECVD